MATVFPPSFLKDIQEAMPACVGIFVPLISRVRSLRGTVSLKAFSSLSRVPFMPVSF